MKNFMLLLCSAIMPACMFAQQQTIFPDKGNSGNKTTGSHLRQVGSTFSQHDGQQLNLQDSTYYIYDPSAGRGEDPFAVWKYDTAYTIDENGNNTYMQRRTFDNLNNIVYVDGVQPLGSNWVVTSIEKYSYNPAGKRTMEFLASFSGTSWDSTKYSHTYNSQNKIDYTITEQWSSLQQKWLLTTKSVHHYATANLLDTTTKYNWNASANQWDVSARTVYIYMGNNIALKMDQSYTAGNWTSNNKWEYTYDANGIMLTQETFSWNGIAWNKNGFYEYMHDAAGNTTSMIGKTYNGSSYENSFRFTYTYTPTENRTESITFETWNSVTNQFEMEQGNYALHYYYEQYFPAGIAETEAAQPPIILYPVPASNTLYIQCMDKLTDAALLTITDMTGKTVYSESLPSYLTGTMQVNVSSLPAGNYIVNMRGARLKYSSPVYILK